MSMVIVIREWIKSRAYEIAQVSGIGWETTFVDLAAIPGEHKQLERGSQGMDAARETARATSQACQVVSELRVVSFNGVSLAFVGHGQVLTGRVEQGFVEAVAIRVVLPGLRAAIQHGLQGFGRACRHHRPANNAATGAVNLGQDVGFVFLCPTKVNNSSNSFTSNSSAGTGGASGTCAP